MPGSPCRRTRRCTPTPRGSRLARPSVGASFSNYKSRRTVRRLTLCYTRDTFMPRVLVLIMVGLISSACNDSAEMRTVFHADPISEQENAVEQSEAQSTQSTNAAPLEEMDWAIAGIEIGTDSSEVRRMLGDPLELVMSMHPYGPELELVEWVYSDLTVHIQDEGIVYGFTLTGPSIPTRREVRIGHEMETLGIAYGAPTDVSNQRWLYCDPQYDECLRLIQFHTRDDRVSRIWLGVPQD